MAGRRRADARAALRPDGGLGAAPARRLLHLDHAPDRVGRRRARACCSACVVAAAGALSALLANDIVCLAMAPLLVEGCLRRRLDPVPFLLGARLRVERRLRRDADRQPAEHADRPGAAAVVRRLPEGRAGAGRRRARRGVGADPARGCAGAGRREAPVPAVEAPPLDRWQTAKGLLVLAALVVGFLFTSVPHEVLALGAAALLLMSRRMASRDLIGLVDWHLLVLFIGLFVVNHAFARGRARGRRRARRCAAAGVDLGDVRAACSRRDRGAVEPGLERAGGDAAAAARRATRSPGRSWRSPRRSPATC